MGVKHRMGEKSGAAFQFTGQRRAHARFNLRIGKPAAEPALANYHLLPAVRGDLLVKLGRGAEARAEFERAATLTRNARERTLLLDRAAGTTRPG